MGFKQILRIGGLCLGKTCLCPCVALVGGSGVPPAGFIKVLRHAEPLLIQPAYLSLPLSVALLGSSVVPLHSLLIVGIKAAAVLVDIANLSLCVSVALFTGFGVELKRLGVVLCNTGIAAEIIIAESLLSLHVAGIGKGLYTVKSLRVKLLCGSGDHRGLSLGLAFSGDFGSSLFGGGSIVGLGKDSLNIAVGKAVLDDGTVIEVRDFPGFAEKVENKW